MNDDGFLIGLEAIGKWFNRSAGWARAHRAELPVFRCAGYWTARVEDLRAYREGLRKKAESERQRARSKLRAV